MSEKKLCQLCNRPAIRTVRSVAICSRCSVLLSRLPDSRVAELLLLPKDDVRVTRAEAGAIFRQLAPRRQRVSRLRGIRGANYQKYTYLLKEEANWTCSECGWRAIKPMDRVDITAHHPDPSDLYRVVIVCVKCHEKFHGADSLSAHLEGR